MPSFWTGLRAAVDPLVRPYNLYTAYRLDPAERVGTVYAPQLVAGARDYLVTSGYEPQRLSAAKKHPDTGQLHDLSYRRVPDRHPVEVEGTPLAERFLPSECQYHVHVFVVGQDTIEFYSHYEARPDLLEPWLSTDRLLVHYRPRYGEEYFRGVTDLQV